MYLGQIWHKDLHPSETIIKFNPKSVAKLPIISLSTY